MSNYLPITLAIQNPAYLHILLDI